MIVIEYELNRIDVGGSVQDPCHLFPLISFIIPVDSIGLPNGRLFVLGS